jgi:hypothetical protein
MNVQKVVTKAAGRAALADRRHQVVELRAALTTA